MRVLFSSTAGMGHFRGVTPFVDACLAREQEVLVAAPRRLGKMAKSRGYDFVEFEAPPDEEEGGLRSRLPSGAAYGEIYGRLRPRASLPALREICTEWHPDIVVRDRAELGSVLAAELHQIPVVRVSRLPNFEETVIRQCAEPLNELRHALGLRADPGAKRLLRSPRLTFGPASLEDPTADPVPPTFRFRDPRWDEPARRLDHDWGDTRGPLLYVTFGTVTGTLDIAWRVYSTAIQAISELPVRALITAGRVGGGPQPFGATSPNIRAESWINEADAVPASAAVVCHGGAGSILAAAAAGVPLVIIPLFGDQHANARVLSSFGAGTVAELDVDSIRRAILRVLHDDSYRLRARVLADEMRGHASCETVVDVVANVIAEWPAVSPS